MTQDEAKALVNKHASELQEHFDSIRIFVSWPHEDDAHRTLTWDTGRGNFYAQYGQIVQWIIVQDEQQREWARRPEDET